MRHLHPLYVVLRLLLDEVHPLQNVGDVIEASLLHLEGLRGPIEVHHPVTGLGKQLDKLLGQEA